MSLTNPNLPKSVLALRTYNANAFFHDLLAGITVGLVALPLAMAFGIASGVTPQAGGAMEQPSKLLQQSRFVEHLGRENIMPKIQAALDRAHQVYSGMASAIAS